MTEITPRSSLPLDLPRKERDLEEPKFHLALKESDARGPDGQRQGPVGAQSQSFYANPNGAGSTGHGTRGTGHDVAGQMYANLLSFGAGGLGRPAGGPGGLGKPAGGAGGLGGPGGGAGAPGGFGASKPVLAQGSKGADVQTAEDQINGWRAENGRKPIKAD